MLTSIDTTKESNEKIIIVIDSWQNQRYKPMLGGWGTPFQTMNYFSDITGAISIPYSQNTKIHKPNTNLPNGWQWSEEWKIDMSGNYGGIDEEGWSYGVSFESLIASTMQRSASGIKKSLSLVRRRRWIRSRFCASTTVSLLYHMHKERIESLRECMFRASIQSLADKSELIEFETNRLSTHSQVINEIEGDINNTLAMLAGVSEKLISMKALLLERGNIELQYSKRLQQFADKWIDAGDRPSDSVTDQSSNQQNGTKGGFFYLVSAANSSVAQRLEEFATTLTTYLPSGDYVKYIDVDSVLLEVESIKNDCLLEDGPQLRAILISSNESSISDYHKYLVTLDKYNEYIQLNSDRFSSTLTTASAASNTSFESISLFKPLNTAATKEHTNESDKLIPTSLELGVWFSIQLYYLSSLDWEANLLAYQAYINQQRKMALSVISRVSSLLQATIKVFAHEQSRVWLEATTILQTLSKTTSETQNSESIWKEVSDEVIDKKIDIETAISSSTSPPDSPLNISEEGSSTLIKNAFPLSHGLESNYIAIAGKAKYYVIHKQTVKSGYKSSSKSSFGSDDSVNQSNSKWIDAFIVITYDMMLHVFPADTKLKGPMVGNINNNMNSLISIDISRSTTEPILITNEGDGFYIYPSDSTFTCYQHHLSSDRMHKHITNRFSNYGLSTMSTDYQRPMLLSTVSQIGVLLENSNESNRWMRIIRNVFTDLSIDQSITDDFNENDPALVDDSGTVIL